MRGREIHLCFVVPLLVMVKRLLNDKYKTKAGSYELVNMSQIVNKDLYKLKGEITLKARDGGIWSDDYVVPRCQNGTYDGTGAHDHHICKGVYYPYMRVFMLFHPNDVIINEDKKHILERERRQLGKSIPGTALALQVVRLDTVV